MLKELNLSLPYCRGAITRRRVTEEGVEESIIDFVLMSEDLVEDFIEMEIDEKKEHALVKITHQKGNVRKITSDHNVLLSKFKLKSMKKKPKAKIEVFNFKNKTNQEKFRQETGSTKKLSEVFDTNQDINEQTNVFLKRLDRIVHKCFKKIRIGRIKESEYEQLYGKWVGVRHKDDKDSKDLSNELEEELASKYADNIFEKIKEEIDGIQCDEGGINSGKLWQLKKKLHASYPDPPTAMKNSEGELITDEGQILEETVKYYKNVLKNRDINDDLENHKKDREELAKKRMETAKLNTTPDWDMDDLTEALKSLKNNKSSDALGYINELFKPSIIGSDLKLALLRLMNKIKQQQVYPKCLEACNITSIFKNKGSKSDFDKYRGIFRVLVFRSILEKLIYHDEYHKIDANLSDANVGARKGRNIRDNLFVVNAITNSIKRGSQEAVDICAYDAEKCFDALWTYECINDLFDAGLQNDRLTLLFIMNQSAQVAIKTPHGITERVSILNIIMQGTTWGSLFCKTTMDKLPQKIYKDKSLLYMYKGQVSVPPLEMVDDILTVETCGVKSLAMNAEVNSFIEQKKLRLSKEKCVKIHVGKKCESCEKLFVHEELMNEAQDFKYLGDYIHENGKPNSTISHRVKRGYAIVAQIFALLSDLPVGNLRVEISLELRQAWLINGILFNSEVWHSLSTGQIEQLVTIDKYLLRGLVGSHAKAPLEHLYLETAALPISYVLSARRMIYLQTILRRSDEEITKKVYLCQKKESKSWGLV